MDINIIWETETSTDINKEDLEKLLLRGLEIGFQMIDAENTSALKGVLSPDNRRDKPEGSFEPAEMRPAPEVGLMLTDDEGIRVLNRDYRGVDASTDVLSFALLEAEDNEVVFAHEDHMLGDIIISVETAANQAAVHGNSMAQEMVFLAVHALLHLLGYDHELDEDYQVMRQWEETLMHRINEKLFAG